MVYLPASGNWGFSGRRGITWQEVVSVKQQKGEHPQLVMNLVLTRAQDYS